jgi:hypothetical protein
MKQLLWHRLRSAAPICAVFLLVLGSMAAAQQQGTALDDREFATFVRINVELQDLSDEYQAAFEGAREDSGKRAALQQEIQEKSRDVLAKHDLTPDAYRQIYKTVNADPELRAKVLQAIQQERQQPGSQGSK